jgi:DNA-binding PadR family transcriptional regulator
MMRIGAMSSVSLSPTSYVVLGLVALFGESTPYDLKRRVAGTIGHFWSFPHSQLYSEPARLASAGLLEERREEHGRRKRVYRITEAGRAALSDWLRAPVDEARQIRDPGLLKLFFFGLGEPGDASALAEAQAASHRARLQAYASFERSGDPPSEWRYPLATLQMGKRYEQAAVEFWEQLAASPP